MDDVRLQGADHLPIGSDQAQLTDNGAGATPQRDVVQVNAGRADRRRGARLERNSDVNLEPHRARRGRHRQSMGDEERRVVEKKQQALRPHRFTPTKL